MPDCKQLLFGLMAVFALAAGPAFAGAGATGCDDLSGITETPDVDFQAQIQPILDGCTGCHGDGGNAGLDMRAGEAYDNLVGVISTSNPSRLRVDPGNPDFSALFLAVSCDAPAGPGFRMPGTVEAERALIRDWIAQGALPEPAGAPTLVSVPIDARWALLLLCALMLGSGAWLVGRR